MARQAISHHPSPFPIRRPNLVSPRLTRADQVSVAHSASPNLDLALGAILAEESHSIWSAVAIPQCRGSVRVLLGFVVLQHLRTGPSESLAAVKERWRLALTHQGQSPPAPLEACPAHLRPTA